MIFQNQMTTLLSRRFAILFSKETTLWLIVAFGGYMISVFITIAVIVFWSIALVIRLKQNKLARQYIRMQCITCGTNFDVARSELAKGGSVK